MIAAFAEWLATVERPFVTYREPDRPRPFVTRRRPRWRTWLAVGYLTMLVVGVHAMAVWPQFLPGDSLGLALSGMAHLAGMAVSIFTLLTQLHGNETIRFFEPEESQ